MGNLQNIGSFSLSGEKLKFSLNFDVYRRADMLVLEFLNNAFLPMQVKRDCPGGANMLYVKSHPVFDSAISDDEQISIRLYGGVTAGDADIELIVGDLQKPRLSSSIQIRTYGCMGFNDRKRTSYSYEEISAWCKARGVVPPVGFCSALAQFSGHFGYECNKHGNLYVISFPNGFRFPILRHSFGVTVVDSDICFGSAIRCLCVRVREISDDHVLFRLTIVSGSDGEHIMQRDNIRYGREYVEYGGRKVRTTVLTKQLLMSGG